jgi:5-formyltetrahydrofolate cyclo-ligase
MKVRWHKGQLRRRMQDKRNRLTALEQHAASSIITERLLRQPQFQYAQHIAFYINFKAEVSTQLLLSHALKLSKSCYLPVITRTHRLNFFKVDSQSSLSKNRYGILEPNQIAANMRDVNQFDLVLMPLVAFDAALHRIGMGGGYYDRTFAIRNCQRRPCLVGLGYDFQRVNQLPHSNLDVSLDLIVTEKRLYKKPI